MLAPHAAAGWAGGAAPRQPQPLTFYASSNFIASRRRLRNSPRAAWSALADQPLHRRARIQEWLALPEPQRGLLLPLLSRNGEARAAGRRREAHTGPRSLAAAKGPSPARQRSARGSGVWRRAACAQEALPRRRAGRGVTAPCCAKRPSHAPCTRESTRGVENCVNESACEVSTEQKDVRARRRRRRGLRVSASQTHRWIEAECSIDADCGCTCARSEFCGQEKAQRPQ